jgi:hypothetical protein
MIGDIKFFGTPKADVAIHVSMDILKLLTVLFFDRWDNICKEHLEG